MGSESLEGLYRMDEVRQAAVRQYGAAVEFMIRRQIRGKNESVRHIFIQVLSNNLTTLKISSLQQMRSENCPLQACELRNLLCETRLITCHNLSIDRQQLADRDRVPAATLLRARNEGQVSRRRRVLLHAQPELSSMLGAAINCHGVSVRRSCNLRAQYRAFKFQVQWWTRTVPWHQ
eukprot:762991-Hanusia_phi.AAC.2